MSDILLYIAPGSCSRVPLIALCETGAPFETSVVRFKAGQHKSPAYRQVNPKGKVPALVIDGEAITENIAILTFLAGRFPAAHLLPNAPTPLDAARQIADLSFCGTTLHPIVTRIRLPQMFATPEASPIVWDKASAAMREHFALIENRLAGGDWWYGASWSVMDAYLNWVFYRVEGAEFPVADYPLYAAHARRMMARRSFHRAMEIEAAANATLEAEGMAFTPPPLRRT
jgi:glutathione S-transferase